jgi:hypothetical protein
MPSALPDPKTGLEKETQLRDQRSNRPKNVETIEAPIDGRHVILQYPDYLKQRHSIPKKGLEIAIPEPVE